MTGVGSVAGERARRRAGVKQLYADHRERLIAAAFPTAALVVFAVTLLYQFADLIFVPATFRAEVVGDRKSVV